MPINNFGIINEPGGREVIRLAQPDAQALKDLANLGCEYVIRLNADAPKEAQWCSDAGLVLIEEEIPVLTNGPDVVMGIAKKIQDFRQFGIVAVHCLHGRDRTGLVIGAWRIMYCNWNVDQVNVERAAFGVYGLMELVDAEMVVVLKQIYKKVHP